MGREGNRYGRTQTETELMDPDQRHADEIHGIQDLVRTVTGY